MEIIGIYGIHNLLTDTWYVGQSNNINRRLVQHQNELYKKEHHNKHLQRAYDKYGRDAFQFIVLEECSVELLNEREVYWIAEKDSFNNGYNQTLGGDGTRGYANPKHRKAIVRLDDGCIFDSITEAAEHIGVDRHRLGDKIRKRMRCHGYWMFLPENYSEAWRAEQLRRWKERIAENRRKAVEKRKTLYPAKEKPVNPNGYHKWSNEAKANNKGKNGKPVIQMTLDGTFVAEYASSVIAGEILGINHRKIRMVCNGQRNKTGGFRWKWKNAV